MNNDFIQPPFEHIAEPDPTFEDAIDVLTSLVLAKHTQAPTERISRITIGQKVIDALMPKLVIVPAGQGFDRKASIELAPGDLLESESEEGSVQ
jgi:hypothetical protein